MLFNNKEKLNNKLLLQKMIQKSLKQYHIESNTPPLNEYEELANKIIHLKKQHPSHDLNDLVQDVVYGYITDSPYF
ncbi:YqzH family protein [Cytobacillus oceanisediminis]|uniref:YqzH family protein n=2 Tax=Bacillaceae TaxID=186817 RepID=UPI001CC9472D